jgi:hypothetical protein
MPDVDPELGRCRSRDPRLGNYAEVARCWETALNRLKAIVEANGARELAANDNWVRDRPTTPTPVFRVVGAGERGIPGAIGNSRDGGIGPKRLPGLRNYAVSRNASAVRGPEPYYLVAEHD